MEQAIQIIIGGPVQGSVFAVVALGLSLVFRVDALEILRGLIERVTVVQAETGFAIELAGEIASMGELSSALLGWRAFSREPYRSSVKVVAEARIGRDRHSLVTPI